MEYYIIDRFENGLAVCEKDGETMVNISLSLLPADAHEGSVLVKKADGTFFCDVVEERRRREEAAALTDSLFDE